MKSLRRLLVSFALLLSLAAPLPSMSKGWEPSKANKEQYRLMASASELEIRAGGGVIHLTCSRPVNIKIFTILGSRIADDNLAPGSYQFAVPTHGVYLIKAGDITCKVAV